MKNILLICFGLAATPLLAKDWEAGKVYPGGSSDIVRILYEDKTQTLTIQYKSRKVTEYYTVPRKTFETLMNKRIKGGYVKSNIDGQFKSKNLRSMR